MIKTTVTASDFHDAFHAMNRGEQFTYTGRCALYDYLDDLSDDTGEDIELDVIALCCEYVEYNTIDSFIRDYLTVEEAEEMAQEDVDNVMSWIENYLSERTSIVCVEPDCILFASY